MIGRRLSSMIAVPAILLTTVLLGHAQNITGTGTTGFIPKFTGPTAVGNSIIRTSGTSVAVGVAPLSDYRFYTSSSSSIGGAIFGQNVSGGRGLYGLSSSGIGVHGQSTSSSGVQGESNTSFGIYGISVSGTGAWGFSQSGWGVRGTSGSNDGIYAETSATDSTNAAVRGVALSGAYAGIFQGNVSVTGTLSKGAGSFKIDHPLDPENKYLYHSFVESPDMKNIYDGNIVTNDNGEAVVEMPEYFEALNSDFRYQLTVLGTFAQAIVAEKIKGNRFVIKTNAPNVEVSWQVTGIRQDAFAKKNRIKVEVDKDDRERGFYLHPDAFGLSEERSVERARSSAPMRQSKENFPRW